MKSNAPWSVKGIERDARETAKAAAQREGMTVGEWLNRIIYSAGDPNAAPTVGEIEGLKASDLAAAIEHLAKRITLADSRSAAAVDNLARSLGGAVERLQRLERAEPRAPGADDALEQRVRALEEKGADRQRIEALRALERAVGQIAVQFTNAQSTTVARLDQTERQLQAIASRLEAGAGGETVSAASVREAVEGMAERIARAEKIAAEAARLNAEASESVDADFVQKTGLRLRILGDEIKRGGDQMRALESTISRLAQQIDAAEKRSAEGVEKVAETIADLRSQFASAEIADQASARAEIEAAVSEIAQRTEDRIETLQRSFDEMVRRLESAGGRVGEAEAAPAEAPEPEDEFDSEIEDAFAALELEEPIPTPAAGVVAKPPATASVAAPVEDEDAEVLDSIDEDVDFGFDDEAGEEPEEASQSSETEDVLAEIREAFGIEPPAPELDDEGEAKDAPKARAAFDADLEEPAEAPPLVAAASGSQARLESEADYLKAARRAAREAAAKAAEEEATPRRKLTPKQRAILAARIKRRQQEAEAAKAKASQAVVEAPVEEPDEPAPADAAPTLRSRIGALAAKIKRRPSVAKKPDAEEESSPEIEPEDEPSAEARANPSLVAAAQSALRKLKLTPSGGVISLAVAIVLLLAALFFLTRDIVGRGRPPAPAPVATPVEQRSPESATDGERIDAAPTVRPRELYLENIAALKSATTDGEARVALKRIEEAAALGHPPAQLQIGELYKLGQLYDRDLGAARLWFERAANGGNILAMHRLGVMAARGEGGPADAAASIAWFEKAAGFGLVDSQYNLGATYHPTAEGAGVENGVQNRAKAYFWYSIAAKNGDAQAGEMAAGLGASMPASERSAADAEVAAWAAKTPDPLANELAPAR